MEPLFKVEFLDESSEFFDHVLRLEYEVLYQPFGVARDDDRYRGETPSLHAVAVAGRRLLGSARLLGLAGDDVRQLRQVVVEPAMQGNGVGKALVEAIESRAAQEGTSEIWLNARVNAYPFYERLGYSYDSEEFLSHLTRVPHRRMRKQITPRRS